MAHSDLNAEVLLSLGFLDIGRWLSSGDFIVYELDGENAAANEALLDAKNALYAFVSGIEVLYIGKTARSIRKRYVGYCRPGKRQATNQRCHRNIKDAIGLGTEIRIFAFAPISHLRYADFEINLAAGLEDSLISQFDPRWNGKDRGQPISEDAEREEADEAEVDRTHAPPTADFPPEPKAGPTMATFSVVLGPTYYNQGLLNLGIEASEFLGKDGDPVRVLLGDDETVVSKINRTANRTGAVRVVGGNSRIARWFRGHFREGDVLEGRVLDPHTILLLFR
ncbi:GIY-YIG nuclease family protein [Mesorhizobium sp. M2C.T.Ca.TU.002.02.1.1]|uniref:GIY-YIG nuclease family protein n=1 Tax=Mesorhizobium sp. M2C.T.Ca.TU.002.02.1.1 TaxID=2496788 RepID=UPI001FDF9144|nr:GIY-YIG nuclease family protein [Mesorhizobium sp. M2C.T.Ca.TU.002.02.1.1]